MQTKYFKFIVFPNPSDNVLNIKGNVLENDNYRIVLTNILGQPLISIDTESVNNIVETKFNIKELSSGIYFLTIASRNFKQTMKVLKN